MNNMDRLNRLWEQKVERLNRLLEASEQRATATESERDELRNQVAAQAQTIEELQASRSVAESRRLMAALEDGIAKIRAARDELLNRVEAQAQTIRELENRCGDRDRLMVLCSDTARERDLLELRLADVDTQVFVTEFHRKFGQAIGERPHIPSDDVIRLRLKLAAEEFFELLEASIVAPGLQTHIRRSVLKAIGEAFVHVDFPEFIDAHADIAYINVGTMVTCGVDLAPVIAEVHRANMRKDGGGTREDGKILKPEGWQPPDIESELRRQGWDGPR